MVVVALLKRSILRYLVPRYSITYTTVRVSNNAVLNTSYHVTRYGRVIERAWARYGRVIRGVGVVRY